MSPSRTFGVFAGLASELGPFLEILRGQNVFVREVETWGVAYHSPALGEAVPDLTEGICPSVLGCDGF